MTYEEIEIADQKFIKKTEDSGKTWTFPENPANRHYAEYLRYTAWVEAGNKPEDFWNQTEEI